MQIFSGSSNIPLAQQLAVSMDIEIGQVELTRFDNDELRVWVREPRVDKEVIVAQSLGAPVDHNLIEFLMLVDALRRSGARDFTAVIPYLGYSKQDKVFRAGESLASRVIADLLTIIPLSRLITFDLHNQAITGFYNIPVTNLSALPIFIDYFGQYSLSDSVVVAPDAGAAKKAGNFAMELNLDIAYIDKKRDLNSGKVMIKGITGEVRGKDVIICDDMVATGSTLIESSNFLSDHGAKSITIAVTHFLNVPGVSTKLQNSKITKILTTNTIDNKSLPSKFQVLDVAPIIKEALT